MLESLKKIFSQSQENFKQSHDKLDVNILCGLMIEAAQIDGKIDQVEIDKISKILIEKFQEESTEVELTLKKCLKEINEPKSLHFFTSKINKIFSNKKKDLLIETLWSIILADGEIHEYESNLIRRLSGLLYISDVSCGNAKKRVLNKLQISSEKKI